MDKIKNVAQHLGIITVEEMERYTALELIMMIANKLNDNTEKVQYLFDKGLLSEVGEIFDEWLNDGTFDTLINQSVLKDVNESIDEANAALKDVNERIDETNVKLSTKASNADLAAERSRIDTIVALPEGSTAGDAELQDIRVGIDGEIYESAGTAVREQIKDRTRFVEKVTQYLSEAARKNGYFYAREANYADNYSAKEGVSIYTKINIKKGVTYYFSNVYGYFCRIVYENGTKANFSDATKTAVSGTFKAADDGYVLITIDNKAAGTSAMFTDGKPINDDYFEGTHYVNNGFKIAYKDIVNKPLLPETKRVTQYLSEASRKDGYFYARTATYSDNYSAGEDVSIYPKIIIKKGVTYYYKDLYAYFCSVVYQDKTRFNLSDLTKTKVSGSFLAEQDGYILITTSNTASGITAMFADGEIIWDSYTEDSYQLINDSLIPYENVINVPQLGNNANYIHVKKDGTGDFTSLVNAIKSIGDNSSHKIYTIYVYDNHDMVAEMGGQSYFERLSQSADRASVYIPPYVNIFGVGLVKLFGKIERSWNVTNNIVKSYSLIEVKEGNNRFENLIFEAQNTRYAVHDESNGKVPNTKVEWHNCQFRHLGNDDFNDLENPWISTCAYGMGSSSLTVRNFYGCYFESKSFYPFSCHDNYNFKDGTVLTFNYCEFNNRGGNPSHDADVRVSTYGTGTAINTASINNCILRKITVVRELSSQKDVQNRWKVKGGGNSSTSMAEGSELSMPHFITIK